MNRREKKLLETLVLQALEERLVRDKDAKSTDSPAMAEILSKFGNDHYLLVEMLLHLQEDEIPVGLISFIIEILLYTIEPED